MFECASYDTLTADAFPARIWEVARATSVAPMIFPPIYIGDVKYGDGSTGWSNLTKEAIADAQIYGRIDQLDLSLASALALRTLFN